MRSDPRHIAYKVLVRIEEKYGSLDETLEKSRDGLDRLSDRDRSLAGGIIFGTLRWQLSIDWIIKAFSDKDLKRIDVEVLVLLRMALFQIIYMDRIPPSAAVNTAVSIAGQEKGKGAAGFVNAVLRKACKEYASVPPPDPSIDPLFFTSIEKSIPLWLVKRWMNLYGRAKSTRLFDAVNEIPPITLRTNTLKTDRENLFKRLEPNVSTIEWTNLSPLGLSVTGPKIPLHETDAFKKGFFQVQDEAAQLTTSLLAPAPGEKILDVCAGLGGKTGHIGQLMDNTGHILAADVHSERLFTLEREMKRLGIDITETQRADILKGGLETFTSYFDRVLVDAPCTGLGVLRRNPDAKWNKSVKDIRRNAEKQKQILLAAADLVRPGGILLHAVCSAEPEENEEVIDSFMDKRDDFCVEPCSLPGMNHEEATLLFTNRGFFKSYPAALFMDGFFAAKLVKNAGSVGPVRNASLKHKPYSGEPV